MKRIFEIDEVDSLKELIGNKVVLVGGCFDILHLGHIDFLEKAKEQGEVLVVLIEEDEKIRKDKGEGRPVNNQDNRALLLSKLQMVDYVVKLKEMKSDEDYDEVVKKIKPAIIAITEGDERVEKKKKQAKEIRAEVIEVSKLIPQQSSSQIIEIISKKE